MPIHIFFIFPDTIYYDVAVYLLPKSTGWPKTARLLCLTVHIFRLSSPDWLVRISALVEKQIRKQKNHANWFTRCVQSKQFPSPRFF